MLFDSILDYYSFKIVSINSEIVRIWVDENWDKARRSLSPVIKKLAAPSWAKESRKSSAGSLHNFIALFTVTSSDFD